MTHSRPRVSRWAIRGLYFFTFILIFWPIADLITNVWPLQPGNVQWRYGFMGLLAGFLHTPILGLALAMSLAYAMKHGRTLRMLSAINLIGAAGLLAALLVFPLDVVQLESAVPTEGLPSFQGGSLITEFKYFTSFLAQEAERDRWLEDLLSSYDEESLQLVFRGTRLGLEAWARFWDDVEDAVLNEVENDGRPVVIPAPAERKAPQSPVRPTLGALLERTRRLAARRYPSAC